MTKSNPRLRLPQLMEEVTNVLETYYSVWPGNKYHKMVFILCDDCTELVSKLYMLTQNPDWSDEQAPRKYKGYHEVLKEVEGSYAKTVSEKELTELKQLHERMRNKHQLRNQFFHSTNVLQLTLEPRSCADGLLDLMYYGSLLFGAEWGRIVEKRRVMRVYEVLLRIEHASFEEPKYLDVLKDLLRRWTRKGFETAGVQQVQYGEDLYLRLCVEWGGTDFLDEVMGIEAVIEDEGLVGLMGDEES